MTHISFNILNLERRRDRRDVMAGNLQTLGVPFDNVTFHAAPDAMEYEITRDICDAAVAEGFPIFETYRNNHNKGSVATFWGACQILRHIASDEHSYEYGYYNQDDIIFKMPYRKLQEIIMYLEKYSRDTYQSPFLILQMRTFFGKPHKSTYEPRPIFPTSFIQRGLYGKGEVGLVLSKEGAAFLLEKAMELGGSLETMLHYIDPDLPGTFSFLKDFEPIETFNTKFWGKGYEEDQDRILANNVEKEVYEKDKR